MLVSGGDFIPVKYIILMILYHSYDYILNFISYIIIMDINNNNQRFILEQIPLLSDDDDIYYYGQKRLTMKTPGINIDIFGNALQLIKIMEALSEYKNKNNNCDDDDYKPVSNEDINSLLDELQNKPSCPPKFPSKFNANDPTSNWPMIQLGGQYKFIRQDSKYYLTSNLDGCTKYYSGSGIMIFERKYKNLNGREELAVILFRSSLTGEYEELGGSIDVSDWADHNTLINTAKREVKEESYNLFNFDRVDIANMYRGINKNMTVEKNVTKGIPGEIYQCYAICLAENQNNNEWKQMYEYNKILINNNRLSTSCWRETNDMERFFLSDFMSCSGINVQGPITMADSEGVVRSISGRTRTCLNMMLKDYTVTGNSIIDVVINSARTVVIVKNNALDNMKPFLLDTISIIVN